MLYEGHSGFSTQLLTGANSLRRFQKKYPGNRKEARQPSRPPACHAVSTSRATEAGTRKIAEAIITPTLIIRESSGVISRGNSPPERLASLAFDFFMVQRQHSQAVCKNQFMV